jgi:hypothetical protein
MRAAAGANGSAAGGGGDGQGPRGRFRQADARGDPIAEESTRDRGRESGRRGARRDRRTCDRAARIRTNRSARARRRRHRRCVERGNPLPCCARRRGTRRSRSEPAWPAAEPRRPGRAPRDRRQLGGRAGAVFSGVRRRHRPAAPPVPQPHPRLTPPRVFCGIVGSSNRTRSPFVRKWRNWQTRKPQELVAARSWRFKSSLPHHL